MMRLIKGETYFNKDWYGTWHSMMDRCYRRSAHNYQRYGGRGISVCDEWHDIRNFEKWVLSSGYEKGKSIDRINPNGDYCPKNCRWASKKEQANNRCNSVRIEYKGETHTISEWSEIIGVNRSTLSNRYYRGWGIEKMLERR